MDLTAARKTGQPIRTAIAYLSCKLSNTELPAIVHKALDDSKLLAVTVVAADDAVALLLTHYSCSSLRHHLDRVFYGNCVHRTAVSVRCPEARYRRGRPSVEAPWRAVVASRSGWWCYPRLCSLPEERRAAAPVVSAAGIDISSERHAHGLPRQDAPPSQAAAPLGVPSRRYAGWRAELCPAVAAAGLAATERWKAHCCDLQCTGCDFWFETTRVCSDAPGTALGGTSSLKWPRPLVLPSNSRKSSLSTSSFDCNWQTKQWTGFPSMSLRRRQTPPDLPVLTAAPLHPRTRTESPYPEATLITLVTWSMALPDTGVKWVTYSLPGSAMTAACSSAVLSPPRPVLVWSCRPSKYKALISSSLCCESRVVIALCLIRHHFLQTFFGSTNSFVLPPNARSISIWKPLMTAATARLDKPYLSALPVQCLSNRRCLTPGCLLASRIIFHRACCYHWCPSELRSLPHQPGRWRET